MTANPEVLILKHPSKTFAAVIALTLGATAVGCEASSRDYCRKIVRECEYAEPNYGIDQCEAETDVYLDDIAESPEADTLTEEYQEYMNCVVDAECGALLDPADPAYPACYDPTTTIY